jgi:hypothetical protein
VHRTSEGARSSGYADRASRSSSAVSPRLRALTWCTSASSCSRRPDADSYRRRPRLGWRRERLGVAPRFDHHLPVSLRPLRPRARDRRTTRKCTRACRVRSRLIPSLQPSAPRPTRTPPKESASSRARRISRPSLRPRTRFHSDRRSARRRTRRRPRPARPPSQRGSLSSP